MLGGWQADLAVDPVEKDEPEEMMHGTAQHLEFAGEERFAQAEIPLRERAHEERSIAHGDHWMHPLARPAIAGDGQPVAPRTFEREPEIGAPDVKTASG